MSVPVIELRDIRKCYDMGGETLEVLKGLNLTISANEYIALTGPSGSGKSTLMNIIGCLDKATSGDYILAGRDVSSLTEDQLASARNRDIGFIFQSFNLLPRMTALENVAQPLVFRGVSRAERIDMAKAALDKVGLAERFDHYPNQLSGGQRQRVAIARALAGKPSLLLADEPTGNLDSTTTQSIMSLFDELQAEGQTIVIVTHEPDIARHCKREITLIDGNILSESGKSNSCG